MDRGKQKTIEFINQIEQLAEKTKENYIVEDSRGKYNEKNYLKKLVNEAKELIDHNEWFIALENTIDNLYEIDYKLEKYVLNQAAEAITNSAMDNSRSDILKDMDVKTLIPKDKCDMETAGKLKKYQYEHIKSIIPELLEWLQDCNWPVSGPVSEYLKTIPDKLSGNLAAILKGNDDIWKYWILTVFFYDTTKYADLEVMNEIERIAFYPSKGEIEEEVSEIANEILNRKETKPE